ncbi:cytochrome P450 [Hyalangium versicolor]|uniref:cytochrome P450 n=1 Tax=Hyalangium versicolor TaxID=2861190 RepID=UPI001CCCF8A3|nr:cytochrome P450 [Hyalangium versicolor]
MNLGTINTFHPFIPPLRDNPHPFFTQARTAQPVFFSDILQAWVVTRYEDLYTVLQDPKRFSSANNLAVNREALVPEVQALLRDSHYRDPPLVNEDAPIHTRRRAHFKKVFSQEAIRSLAPHILATTNRLVDGFINDGRANMVEQFTFPLPMSIILSWMDIPQSMLHTFRKWGDAWVLLLFASMPPEQQRDCASQVVELQRYVADCIRERQGKGRDDAMSQLVTNLLSQEELTTEELAGMISGAVIAGRATLTSSLGIATRVLLQQPGLWKRLAAEPALIPQAVDEALRLESPFWGLHRTTTEAVNVGGVDIPAGARVMIAFISANRDEGRFANPDSFQLERSNAAHHVAFGKGTHVCVGSGLAKQELHTAMEVLTQRLPDARLVDQEFAFVPGLLRQHAYLNLEWTPTRN